MGQTFAAYFSLSSDSSPKTGLSPLLTLRELGVTTVLSSVTMTSDGNGWYYYEYASYNPLKEYVGYVDGATSGLMQRYVPVANNDPQQIKDRIDVKVSSRASLNPPSQTLNDYKANVSNLATSTQLLDVLNLLYNNSRLTLLNYDSDKLMTSASLIGYSDMTLSTVRARWTISAVYDSNKKLTKFEVKRTS